MQALGGPHVLSYYFVGGRHWFNLVLGQERFLRHIINCPHAGRIPRKELRKEQELTCQKFSRLSGRFVLPQNSLPAIIKITNALQNLVYPDRLQNDSLTN